MGCLIPRHLYIDLETYSSIDIRKSGLYRYAQSPDFQILLLAYSIDMEPVQVIDLTAGEPVPDWLKTALFDPQTVKHAYNAPFEWYCLSRFFGLKRPEDWLPQWHCTMLHGLYCGYPAGLGAVGEALNMAEDKKKLGIGRQLIRDFCSPCKPTKSNGQRTRNLPHHLPEKWELFKEYNRQDVVTEMEVERRLSRFPVPADVQAQWVVDQTINLRGVAVDPELVQGALILDDRVKEHHLAEARQLTGLENPNSVSKLTKWLTKETGEEVNDLRKSTVKELLHDLSDHKTKRVLELRQELSKTSTKKYVAIQIAASAGNRLRGLLQFYGANRTGRWSGRLVQPQNLPRTYIDPELLPMARSLVRDQREDVLSLVFGSVPDTLSQLIRTAFVPAEGKTFVDADFSAIEARVVAWLAGEEWVLEVFRTHGKIYEATASQLYGVPMEKIRKGNPEYALRQRGKAATLALGYGGGTSALITAGQLPKDTPEEELLDIRNRWRTANPSIVRFWNDAQNAAFTAMKTGQTVPIRGGTMTFARECDPVNGQDFLTIQLPNKRKLYYVRPHWTQDRWGRPSLGYWGLNQTTKKWMQLETYGGKLVENITQAVARDCLAECLMKLEAAGYPVVFHVHDEVVIETDREPEASLKDMCRIMGQPPAWAPDLPLRAEGWTGDYFRKD